MLAAQNESSITESDEFDSLVLSSFGVTRWLLGNELAAWEELAQQLNNEVGMKWMLSYGTSLGGTCMAVNLRHAHSFNSASSSQAASTFY